MSADTRGLVAIVGAGRNGTTMLIRLLDSSPDLWVHPIDTTYLSTWDDLARLGHVSSPTALNATTRRLTALDRELPTELLLGRFAAHVRDIDEFYVPELAEPFARVGDPCERLRRRPHYGVADFLPAFLEETSAAYDSREPTPRLLVFKTLETPYVHEYVRFFPELRCVHLFREPVANWASLKRSWLYKQSHPFYYGRRDILRTFLDSRWLPHARAALRLAAAEPDRHTIVRYEDLLTDPRGTLAELCGWLGVVQPPDPEQLTALGGRRLLRMPADPAPSQRGVTAPDRVIPDMQSHFAYTDVVSERERQLIAACTRDEADALGYQSASRDRRAQLWFRWLRLDDSERLHVRSRWTWAWHIIRRRLYVTRLLFTRARQ